VIGVKNQPFDEDQSLLVGTNKGLPLNFLRSVKAGCDKSS
jgi:hypothetical protein